MVQQAREWESSGEYARAVECYLKVTSQLTNDTEVMLKCWKKVSTCWHNLKLAEFSNFVDSLRWYGTHVKR